MQEAIPGPNDGLRQIHDVKLHANFGNLAVNASIECGTEEALGSHVRQIAARLFDVLPSELDTCAVLLALTSEARNQHEQRETDS
jgi:hypothetical protein